MLSTSISSAKTLASGANPPKLTITQARRALIHFADDWGVVIYCIGQLDPQLWQIEIEVWGLVDTGEEPNPKSYPVEAPSAAEAVVKVAEACLARITIRQTSIR